jgi:hypothetical protein
MNTTRLVSATMLLAAVWMPATLASQTKLTPRVSWAAGMEPIGGFGSDFSLRHALLGAQQDYESFFAALKVCPAVAFELAPGLTIGASGYAS